MKTTFRHILVSGCVLACCVMTALLGCTIPPTFLPNGNDNGSTGNANVNDNVTANDNISANDNSDDDDNENVNEGNDNGDEDDENANGDDIDDDENENANGDDDDNENSNGSDDDNENANGGDDDNENENENDNTAMMDPFDGIAGEQLARVPVSSPCAQFAGLCTTSFPTAALNVDVRSGQTLMITADGYVVQGSDGDGGEFVQLRGSASALGNTATTVSHEWSIGGLDADPCTLTPGLVFSTTPDPLVGLNTGFHLVRLTVRNDVALDPNSLPQSYTDQCDTTSEQFKFDLVEVLVEVRD